MPGVGFAEVVFGEEDCVGAAVDEADHGVLPVADVVAKADVEDFVAEVVGVKEEPEGVEDAVVFGYDDEDGGCTAAAAGLGAVLVAIECAPAFASAEVCVWSSRKWVWTLACERIADVSTVCFAFAAPAVDRAALTKITPFTCESCVAAASPVLARRAACWQGRVWKVSLCRLGMAFQRLLLH